MMVRSTQIVSIAFAGWLRATNVASFTPVAGMPAVYGPLKDARRELPVGRHAPMLKALHDGNKPEDFVMKTCLPAISNFFASGIIVLSVLAGPVNLGFDHMSKAPPSIPVASAGEARVIGKLSGSGLVFKDTLQVEAFDDPKVQGVTLYLSNFQRPLTERIGSSFFSDPSATGVGCAKTGPIKVADNIGTDISGEEVFKENKSLFFKELRVQRIYDKEKSTVVYVVFNTRLNKDDDSNKSRFKSSLCVVDLQEPLAVAATAKETAAAATP